MNIYRRTFSAICPNNSEAIIYRLEIATEKQIFVEHINTELALISQSYHEAIADRLHAKFGGDQVLIAMHHGVEIETRR
jgi:hypothetical protein